MFHRKSGKTCPVCFNHHHDQKSLDNHIQQHEFTDRTVKFPFKNSHYSEYKFKSYHNKYRAPVIIYSDCEAYLNKSNEMVPYSIGFYNTFTKNSSKAGMNKSSISEYNAYFGLDCIERYIEYLESVLIDYDYKYI